MLNCFNCVNGALPRSSVLISTLLVSSSALAALGQDVSSVQSDGVRMKAAVSVLPGQSFSVHEMRASTGTRIREFVTPAGQVFGVSWQGSSIPDLRQLLGEYFDQYMQAAQTTPRVSRRMVHIETGDLVFESSGHMRFVVGRAYLRAKVPNGVSADAIR
ncbi:MAG: hypothetical protein JWN74_246 [Acidobacteriaceae bacterium]|nr:hypothetical protein [Acidobacteriaceae bacterium]